MAVTTKPLIQVAPTVFARGWDEIYKGVVHEFASGKAFDIHHADGSMSRVDGDENVAATLAIWRAATRPNPFQSAPADSASATPKDVADWMPIAQQVGGGKRAVAGG